jgi:hypothetical protein
MTVQAIQMASPGDGRIVNAETILEQRLGALPPSVASKFDALLASARFGDVY